MGGKSSTWMVLALVVGVFGVMAYLVYRPSEFPNLTVTSASETLSIDQVRGERSKLVLVMLLPGCGLSKSAVQTLKAEHPDLEGKATFAGVLLAAPPAAAAYQQEHELPFPVYALNPQDDPGQYNTMVEAVGGFRQRFMGGTVVVLDTSRRITQQVAGDELQELAAKLRKL